MIDGRYIEHFLLGVVLPASPERDILGMFTGSKSKSFALGVLLSAPPKREQNPGFDIFKKYRY